MIFLMLKSASIALAGLLVLGGVVAVWPTAKPQDAGGVQLSGVEMRLYPSQDPNAVWRFGAKHIRYDPQLRQSVLTELEEGQRWVNGKLDMTLQASSLTIDVNDNLLTTQAKLFLPSLCTSVEMGDKAYPNGVTINQNVGFSGRKVHYQDANTTLTAKSIRANFDLTQTQLEEPSFDSALDAKVVCRNGRLVPKPAS